MLNLLSNQGLVVVSAFSSCFFFFIFQVLLTLLIRALQKEARAGVAERWPTHRSLPFYTLSITESSQTPIHAPRFFEPRTPSLLGLLSSKNLFIDNLPSMPRLHLIVRIELRRLLGVEFLTAHKSWIKVT
jgi:hypothetical protein